MFALLFATAAVAAEGEVLVAAASKKKKPPKPKPPPADAPAAETPPPEQSKPPEPPPPPPPPQQLEFDLLKKPTVEAPTVPTAEQLEIEAKVKKRRSMLELHQTLGVITLLGLVGTNVVGQLSLNDRYGGGGDTGQYFWWHLGLAGGTTALFTTVGLLGVLAPSPFQKRDGFDTTRFHQLMMAVATVGMVVQVGLGIYTRVREGTLDQRAFAITHQVIGYTTLGAMTIGAGGLAF
jgi:hypothetical protein